MRRRRSRPRSSFDEPKVVAVPAKHQAMVGAPPNVPAPLSSTYPRRSVVEEVREGDSDDLLRCGRHCVDAYLRTLRNVGRRSPERDLHHVADAGVSKLADSSSQEVDRVQRRDSRVRQRRVERCAVDRVRLMLRDSVTERLRVAHGADVRTTTWNVPAAAGAVRAGIGAKSHTRSAAREPWHTPLAMDGTAGDPTVAKAKGRLVLELLVIMLVGILIGLALALALSWATNGFISFWDVMVPAVISAVVVPLWTNWSNRRTARR